MFTSLRLALPLSLASASGSCVYGPLTTHVGEMWVKPGENDTVTHKYTGSSSPHWLHMPAKIFRGANSKDDMMSFVEHETSNNDFVLITDAVKFDRTSLEVMASWEVDADGIKQACHSFAQCTPEGVQQPPSRDIVRAARDGVEPVCTFCHGSHTHSNEHHNQFYFANTRAADGSFLPVIFIRHGSGAGDDATWVTHVNEVMIVKKDVLQLKAGESTNPFCDVYQKQGVELGPDENNALVAMMPLTMEDLVV